MTDDEVVFRFRLATPPGSRPSTLDEFYRQSIRDLLQVVRLFANGKPVIVDSFAFLKEPSRQIRILD